MDLVVPGVSSGEDWYDGEQFTLLRLEEPFRPIPSFIPDAFDFPVKFSVAV